MMVIENDDIYVRSIYVNESSYQKYIIDDNAAVYFDSKNGYIYKNKLDVFGIKLNLSKDLLQINSKLDKIKHKELLEQIDSFKVLNELSK